MPPLETQSQVSGASDQPAVDVRLPGPPPQAQPICWSSSWNSEKHITNEIPLNYGDGSSGAGELGGRKPPCLPRCSVPKGLKLPAPAFSRPVFWGFWRLYLTDQITGHWQSIQPPTPGVRRVTEALTLFFWWVLQAASPLLGCFQSLINKTKGSLIISALRTF